MPKAKPESKSTDNMLKRKGFGSGSKQSKKAAKDPNKPKRPPSAFFLFMSEFREQYKKDYPENKSVANMSASESEPTPTEIPEPAPAEPASVPLECAEPAHEVSSEDRGYSSNSEYMHTPVSSEDEGNYPLNSEYMHTAAFGHVQLELGMEFANLTLFKNAVRDFNISLGRDIKWKKNDKKRARAVCANEECKWVVLCSWESKLHTFQIKTFNDVHTCSRTFKNKCANKRWVANRLEDRLATQPDIKKKQAMTLMKEDFLLHLEHKKVNRALKIAREAVEGSEKKQYGQLWDYLEEVHKTNPGSTAVMEVNSIPNSPPVFQRLFVALNACIEGFKHGCRPMIGLDGCFLKGYYGGQLLSAVGQDANNHFYVVAYAVVDSETKDSWKWFLTLLQEALGSHEVFGWNFISDQHKLAMQSWRGMLMPVQQRRLEKIKVDSFKWTPTWIGNIDTQAYEVKHRAMKLGVSLTNHTCTCQKWQLTGLPCEHAIAAIAFNNERPENYAHRWLTLDAFNATYSHCINPISSHHFWVSENQKPSPVPPKLKRPSGRPKKSRRRDAYSEAATSTSHSLPRAWKPKCPKCNEEGHYAKSCKGPAIKKQKKNGAETAPENVLVGDVEHQQTQESAIGSSSTALAVQRRNVRYPVLLFEDDPPATLASTPLASQPDATTTPPGAPQAKRGRQFVPPRRK